MRHSHGLGALSRAMHSLFIPDASPSCLPLVEKHNLLVDAVENIDKTVNGFIKFCEVV